MNPEIKQRIEQLNNGEIPDGYKKTEFGVFPCDWETGKTFGDLFDFYGGLSKSRDELGKEGYAYLHYGDLHRGSFSCVSLEQYNRLPKCDITLKGKETCLMEDGDVAFLDASEDLEGTSRAVLIDNPANEPFIAGLHIIYGKSKDDSLEKWYKQYITSSESVKKQFQRLSVGFKVYGVNRDSLPQIRIAYPPSLQEQSRIAEILMKWDEAIELYNKQIELLTQYKAVCLKKMFPSKGATVPEWRFKGFTDAWEQRKLGDCCEQLSTTINPQDTPDMFFAEYSMPAYDNNENPDIVLGESMNSVRKVIDRPCLLINKLNVRKKRIWHIANPEKNAVCSAEFVPVCSDTVDLRFVKYIVNGDTFTSYLEDCSSGSSNSQKRVTPEVIMSAAIVIPRQTEQTKIANCLVELDNLITLHQRKLEIIQHQRKVLQQYLLNGIVRVK